MDERRRERPVPSMEGKNVTPDLKILVAVPSSGKWHSATSQCVAENVANFIRAKYEGEKDITVSSIVSSILPEARQRLVGEAWKWGATHLLFVDSDMAFPFDAFTRLVQHGMPIVGCNYARKNLMGLPTAYCEDDELIGSLYGEKDSEGLRPVKHMGFGLCLIDMRVFEAIDFPFFMFEPTKDGFKFKGEDVYFFEKCREAGLTPMVDMALSEEVKHLGDFEYTQAFARAARDADAVEYKNIWEGSRTSAA